MKSLFGGPCTAGAEAHSLCERRPCTESMKLYRKAEKMRKGEENEKVKKSICSDCITGNGPGIVYDGIRGSGIVQV